MTAIARGNPNPAILCDNHASQGRTLHPGRLQARSDKVPSCYELVYTHTTDNGKPTRAPAIECILLLLGTALRTSAALFCLAE